jgi:aspartyl-tRNA(Asn)/glutamyl-tRNA(Gln) amidotransferase subunit C
MSISPEAIARIAHLARLPSENTRDSLALQDDLGRIVQMVNQITEADTQGIVPMAHPLNMNQEFRADEVTEQNERDLLIKLSSKAEAGLYLVPQVIE